MALEQVRKSDKSGATLQGDTGARVRIEFYDGRRLARRADLTDEEVDQLLGFAREVEPRAERRRTPVQG